MYQEFQYCYMECGGLPPPLKDSIKGKLLHSKEEVAAEGSLI